MMQYIYHFIIIIIIITALKIIAVCILDFTQNRINTIYLLATAFHMHHFQN